MSPLKCFFDAGYDISREPKTEQASPEATVNLNSGFIIAYDIGDAIDAIRKNPIGPLRAAH